MKAVPFPDETERLRARITALEATVARLTTPVTEEDVRTFKRSYLVNVGISDDPDGAALTAFLERRIKGC